MKTVATLLVGCLLFINGLPLKVFAQGVPEVFALPDAIAGDAYRANVESVLRETYHLRLESNARASIFRWAVVQGELPAGLLMRANGAIVGIPRVPRAEPYRFQLKVADISSPRGEPLTLDFTMMISAPRVRLAHINAPRLVRTVAANETYSQSEETQPGDSPQRATANEENRASAIAGPSRTPSIQFSTLDQVYTSMLKPKVDTYAAEAVGPQDGPCDPNSAPHPSATPGPNSKNVILIDARSGTAISETLRFKKGERVRVIIDNKNPYLYTYKYSTTATDVKETALGTFLALLGGPIVDLLPSGDAAKKAPQQSAEVKAQEVRPRCEEAKNELGALEENMKHAAKVGEDLAPVLSELKKQDAALKKAYDAGRKQLTDGKKSRGELFCASKDFLKNTEGIVIEANLKTAIEKIENLKGLVDGFGPRIEFIKNNYPPECIDPEFLLRASIFANGLADLVDKDKKAADKISSDLETVNKMRDSVATVLRNPNSFFEEHVEGGFDSTKEVEATLELTPIEKETAASGPYKVKFKIGSAPFFSLSGGMVFSPLRKFEYDRIQGFERDQQGNLVLTNGKPNLTTVVGLKESSRTRITPIVFLNGRVHDWDKGPIDGLHVSLGITAKNDNKGLDPEFLVGPSLSMLERKLFLTVGGYAGRQQKLTGGLYEGFAVPSTVTDLPIQKNYRWSFGFALSYQLPVNTK